MSLYIIGVFSNDLKGNWSDTFIGDLEKRIIVIVIKDSFIS